MNASARPVRCGQCGAHYSAVAYDALEQVTTLEREILDPIVTDWPRGVKILVRACKTCARPIARLSRPA
jgi:hypothetical protein